MTSVLITRPVAMAAPLAERLKWEGYEVVVEPLLRIVPAIHPRPDLGSVGAVIFTSANAPETLKSRGDDITALLDLPCFCVGPRTAAAAQALGFWHVMATEGSGKELAEFILKFVASDAVFPFPARGERAFSLLLHICGEDRAGSLQATLEAAGCRLLLWPVYKAEAAEAFSPELQERLHARRLQAALFFSPRTAEAFARLAAWHELASCCDSVVAIALSEAVRDAAQILPWQKTAVAAALAEDAMIACLRQICPAA